MHPALGSCGGNECAGCALQDQGAAGVAKRAAGQRESEACQSSICKHDTVPDGEIGDRVAAKVGPGIEERIRTRAAGHPIGICAAAKRIVAVVACKGVKTPVSTQDVVCRIANQLVRTASANRVLDRDAPRNYQIANVAVPEAAIGLGIQVDDLAAAEAGVVECIDPAAVVDRVGDIRKQVRVEDVAARVRVEAIGRVARPGSCRKPVHEGHRNDVGHHWRDDPLNRESLASEVSILLLVEVGHDRHGPAIILVHRFKRITCRVIVIASMAEAQGVADLMDIGLEGVAIESRAVIRQPGGLDVNEGRTDDPARYVARRIGPLVTVIKRDLGSTGRRRKRDPDHVAPQIKGRACQILASGGERSKVDRDVAARRNIEMAVVPVPIAFDQLLGHLIVGADRRRGVGRDA